MHRIPPAVVDAPDEPVEMSEKVSEKEALSEEELPEVPPKEELSKEVSREDPPAEVELHVRPPV